MSKFGMRIFLVLLVAGLLPACGSSGSSGGGAAPVIPGIPVAAEAEPNDTFGTATALPAGEAGSGNLLLVGDVDFWSFSATADQVIQVFLHGNRIDQATWTAAVNDARVQLIDTNGTTVLATPHTSFNAADAELDFLRIPATGTYFLRVFQGTPANVGGRYAVGVKVITEAVQFAAEVGAAVDTFATAEAMTGSHVIGVKAGADATDIDFYSFTVAGPTHVRIDLRYRRAGQVKDATVALLDTNGTTQLISNDDAFGFDSMISYAITTAGTYFVRVEEFGAGTGTTESYCLSVVRTSVTLTSETEANDTFATANAAAYGATMVGGVDAVDVDFYSFAGQAGDVLRFWTFDFGNLQGATTGAATVSLLGTDGITVLAQSTDAAVPLSNQRTILQTTGTFFIRVSAGAATSYAVHLLRLGAGTYETEPNDGMLAAASLVDAGSAGVINGAGDVDTYAFTAEAGRLTTIRLVGGIVSGLAIPAPFKLFGSVLSPRVTVYDAGGTLSIVSATSALTAIGTLDETYHALEVSFVAPATGTYYIDIADAGGAGGLTRFYVVSRP